jgi:RNA polymerase sigma-70 factor (ECF subfamily)
MGASAAATKPAEAARARAAVVTPGAPPSFEEIYDRHADMVWRSLRRLGLDDASAEDALQEVFMVVHRRIGEFEGRSSLQTWLFGIIIFVVRNHKRSLRRRRTDASDEGRAALDEVRVDERSHPDEQADRTRAVKILYDLLDRLGDDQREVFVMAELEQMKGTEIAAATGVNLNTVYARLNAARQQFEQGVARLRARQRSAT